MKSGNVAKQVNNSSWQYITKADRKAQRTRKNLLQVCTVWTPTCEVFLGIQLSIAVSYPGFLAQIYLGGGGGYPGFLGEESLGTRLGLALLYLMHTVRLAVSILIQDHNCSYSPCNKDYVPSAQNNPTSMSIRSSLISAKTNSTSTV